MIVDFGGCLDFRFNQELVRVVEDVFGLCQKCVHGFIFSVSI